MIPAWQVGALALLNALEYMDRARRLRERRYAYIGRAFARLCLAVIYFYFAMFSTDVEVRAYWIRWGLSFLLFVDLLFALSYRISGRYIK